MPRFAAHESHLGPHAQRIQCLLLPASITLSDRSDIGGTFTDFILVDGETGAVRLHKCLTTPHDPARGALTGLMEVTTGAGLDLAAIGDLVHGTTLVTNAIIERRGARVGLLTTKGFRDVLEMGKEQRYDIYDLFLQFPEPGVACAAARSQRAHHARRHDPPLSRFGRSTGRDRGVGTCGH